MKKVLQLFVISLFILQTNLFPQIHLTRSESQSKYSPIGELASSTNIDSFITATMSTYHIPGLSACLVRDGEIIWKGAYGWADIQGGRRVTDSTLFKLASVSKPFTGTALMQLWENGFFQLDEDINNHLPFQVRNPNHPADSITFRMLLTHTSSINDNFAILNTLKTWGHDCPVPLDSFLTNYLVPGGIYWASYNYNGWGPLADYNYSNVGVSLVAYLVETISNIPFAQYCKDSLFIPLGMNETAWFLSDLDTNNIAVPYHYEGGTNIPYPHYGEAFYPSSGLMTSAVQLARFLIAFMQNGQIDGVLILDSTTVDLMTTVQFPWLNDQQALIWFIYPWTIPGFGTYTFCGHTGSYSGVRTGIDYTFDPNMHTGVVVLTNGESDDGRNIIWDKLYEYSLEITDVEDIEQLPSEFSLSQNYPNPFNPSTLISYQLPVGGDVILKIYDILGNEISTLVDEYRPAGKYETEFNATSLPSGVYFYQLKAGSFIETKKMVLIK